MALLNTTIPAYGAESTTELTKEEYIQQNISPWVHISIMILGFITNPMILIVLRKKKIGSEF
mgnify:FL=1